MLYVEIARKHKKSPLFSKGALQNNSVCRAFVGARILEEHVAVTARILCGNVLVVLHARAGGDELADDDVLFQTDERIALGADRRLGEHAARFLEGRRRKETVGCERGFGDAEQHAFCRCGNTARLNGLFVLFLEGEHIDELTGKQIGRAGVFDTHLTEHLTDDDFDVFIVDVNALRTVNRLHLFENIVLHALDAFHADDVLRVDRTGVELHARRDLVARLHFELGIEGKFVILDAFARRIVGDDDVFEVVFVVDRDRAAEFADRRNALGFSRLEKFFDTGKTLRDVARSRDAARVEGSHRELRAGLADRLRRDDADRLAHLNGQRGRHVLAVALCAYAETRIAVEDRTDADAVFTVFFDRGDLLRHRLGDHFVAGNEHFAVLVHDVLGGKSARQTVFEALDGFAVGAQNRLHHRAAGASARRAILFAHDNVLRDVDKTAGKITKSEAKRS